jgi:hypothetical protein
MSLSVNLPAKIPFSTHSCPIKPHVDEDVFNPALTIASQIKLDAIEAKFHPNDPIKRTKFVLLKLPASTSNLVYQVFKSYLLSTDKKSSRLIAYFKVSCNAESGAIIERLMWKTAKKLGLEQHFVCTKVTKLSINNSWNPLIGSIQPNVKGDLVRTLINQNSSIPHVSNSELYSAIFASWVLGLFDAHEQNIFITPDGKVVFFDNEFSLPPANSMIHWGTYGYLRSSYRCALLDFHERVSVLLNKAERAELLQKAKSCLEKMEDLQKYLNEPAEQEKLEELPPRWLDLPAALAAMRERITHVIDELETNQPISILDLIVGKNTAYKFVYSSYIIDLYMRGFPSWMQFINRVHGCVSILRFAKKFKPSVECGFEFDQLALICNETKNFATFINRLKSLIYDWDPSKNHTSKNYQTFSALTIGLPLDHKMCPPMHIELSHTIAANLEKLAQIGIFYYPESTLSHIPFKEDPMPYILGGFEETDMYLYYQQEGDWTYSTIDLSNDGYATLDLIELPLDELKKLSLSSENSEELAPESF